MDDLSRGYKYAFFALKERGFSLRRRTRRHGEESGGLIELHLERILDETFIGLVSDWGGSRGGGSNALGPARWKICLS